MDSVHAGASLAAGDKLLTSSVACAYALAGVSAFSSARIVLPEAVDWHEVFRAAREQEALPLVFYGVKHAKPGPYPGQLMDNIEEEVRNNVVLQCARHTGFVELLGKAEKTGLHPVIMKGMAIAECYNRPDTRVSGDIDIIIPQAELGEMLAFLQSAGFSLLQPEEGLHHVSCIHKHMGLLEVHTDYFRESSIWLHGQKMIADRRRGVFRAYDTIGSYASLEPTMHMQYIVLHAFNHFANTGGGIKMYLDIVAYYLFHKTDIDKAKVIEAIDRVGGRKFLQAVLALSYRLCGVKTDLLRCEGISDDILEAMLRDLKRGGNLGMKEFEKRALQRNQFRRKKNMRLFYLAAVKEKTAMLYRMVFPSARTLKSIRKRETSGYVSAWISNLTAQARLIAHSLARIKTHNKLDAGPRDQLLKQLDML
ncbi:MAG: nucleotidyltransferase family protein [Clostridia bacterium]|nr:nucleotidyltransferase family protein [Clostridia bacterium]